MIPLDLVGSVLNFAGGAVLTLDALRVRARIRAEDGAQQLQELLEKSGAGQLLTDKAGRPLNSPARLKLWLSASSLRWAWLGFALMTLGFLAEFLAHWVGRP